MKTIFGVKLRLGDEIVVRSNSGPTFFILRRVVIADTGKFYAANVYRSRALGEPAYVNPNERGSVWRYLDDPPLPGEEP